MWLREKITNEIGDLKSLFFASQLRWVQFWSGSCFNRFQFWTADPVPVPEQNSILYPGFTSSSGQVPVWFLVIGIRSGGSNCLNWVIAQHW
jgi:hypothetical protein